MTHPDRYTRPATAPFRATALSALALAASIVAGLAVTGCASPPSDAVAADAPRTSAASADARATFAGGCFWCVEAAFDDLPGVASAVSGYTGGGDAPTTYREVSAGETRHLEAVEIRFDPETVTYRELLEVFWRQIDPTDDGGQFADRGNPYRTAIFVHDGEQRRVAEASKRALGATGWFDAPIVTRILDAGTFHVAEDEHQDYHVENPDRYARYKRGSGRSGFLERVWSDKPPILPARARTASEAARWVRPTDDVLRARLTELEYEVVRADGTEPPFRNAFFDHEAEGLYVDVVSGEPLFASFDKFDSGTGWPSFVRPLVADAVVETIDRKLGVPRTEVRSRHADSHLGHVFPDGPEPTGRRYCINSAALRFVPVEDLEREGYGRFVARFE